MILCGTDLSVASEPAIEVAGALAAKHGEDLTLATVIERASERMSAELRVEQEAGELRQQFGINVETAVREGVPELMLLELARETDARMIVVGAEGRARRSRRLGSVSEHLCQTAPVPVLVVRNDGGFLAWSKGHRPLRVVLGSGLGDASQSALKAVAGWPDVALSITHVAWPFGEHYRLGVHGPMPLDHLRPEVHHQVMSDLQRWAEPVVCKSPPKLSVVAGWGRIDAHLAEVARESEADLLVVGSHQRNVAARIWQGSVARCAIREASCNVLCVPNRMLPTGVGSSPKLLVIPTDFSALADRALSYGYGLASPGSTVHLVHVAKQLDEPHKTQLAAQLSARIPARAKELGIESKVFVLEGSSVWLSIWQHASRSGADLICMATHSRDAVGRMLLGSEAQGLFEHTRTPVLFVPPDRES